jgi:opacity protein-like surface antigen
MNKTVLGLMAAMGVSFAGPASAADIAAYPYTKAPIPVAVYDWTGFYIGGNGGGAFTYKCWNLVTDAFGDLPGAEGCHESSGATAGGQIGYRWQTGQVVFGVEGQGNWADLSGSNTSLLFAPAVNRSGIDAFGLITGQVGYAWDNVLLYGKGGAAVTGEKYDVFSGVGGVQLASASDTRWGGVLGLGVEFGFAPGWSVGVEWDHLFLGTRNLNLNDPTGAFFESESIRGDVDIAQVRINYRFGGLSAPVAARY